MVVTMIDTSCVTPRDGDLGDDYESTNYGSQFFDTTWSPKIY
jgi:hypothetical protein